ncbi:MAG: phospholipid methyltransferase [Gemmatimonadetes bacterium]|nr:phospholipid methyltransferase [Gemmatimonadota bacterium]
MPLREELERSGQWLFRWRSYVPLVPLLVTVAAMSQFRYPGGSRVVNQWWDVFCLVVALSGVAVRALVVGYAPGGTSGRNTAQGQIAEKLNSTGMYSLVRHPLYVGNYLMWLGILMTAASGWIVVVISLFYWLYYERIMFAEEEFLRRRFGESYVRWAERTPAFLPRLTGWVRPVLPFSLRNVMKREYSGLFAICLLFPALNLLANYVATGVASIDPWQWGLLIVGTVVYVTLRTLKRRTKVLHVEGR